MVDLYQNQKPQVRRRSRVESTQQILFFKWLSIAHPKVRALTFAIPNGGLRNVVEAVNLKRQGLTKGAPDVFMSVPNKCHHGFYLEFKVNGRKLTTEQEVFFENARPQGYLCEICYDFEEAKELVEDYLKGR